MNSNKLLICLAIFLIGIGCQGQKAKFTNSGANYFGEKISDVNAKELSEISIPNDPADTLNIALKGSINEVCQAKGCWMTFESGDNDASVFIKFKDYGFFVPKDAGGKNAIVSGQLFSSITPVDELRHYASDKGASDEEIAAITEPLRELKMTAKGVIIYND